MIPKLWDSSAVSAILYINFLYGIGLSAEQPLIL